MAGPLEQLGGHDGAAQIVGPTGVDSAEQWVNKALEHRISHAGPDYLANGEVAVDSGAGGQSAIGPTVAGQPLQVGGVEYSVSHGARIEGHAQHVGGGQRPEGTVKPHRGRPGPGGDQFPAQPCLGEQVGRPRHPYQEGVGSLVDRQPNYGTGHQPAPGPRRGL